MFNIEGEFNTATVMLDENHVESECRDQIQEMVDHPAFEGDNDVKIMPDTHWGAGAVIGFTMPVKDKIVPNTIGVDVGCGMYAAKLSCDEFDTSNEEILQEIDDKIRDYIPMGFEVHDRTDYHMENDFPWGSCQRKLKNFNENTDFSVEADYGPDYFEELLNRIGYDTGRAINSMGTLGGGNHFIELGRSEEEDDVYAVIHSGSRGVGARIAEYWQERATKTRDAHLVRDVMDNLQSAVVDGGEYNLLKYVKFSSSSSDKDIYEWLNGAKGESYKKSDLIKQDFNGEAIQKVHDKLKSLHVDSLRDRNTDLDYLKGEEAHGYIRDMVFGQTYALESRKQMMMKVQRAVTEVVNDGEPSEIVSFDLSSIHNYIDFEDGVIRKGACRAQETELVIIPFNMEYGTLIAKGKGNGFWNRSAPHGAGRAMSRTAAEEKFDQGDMSDQIGDVFMSKRPLDEAPGAYKDPGVVQEFLGDSVEVVDRIVPFMSVKAE